MTPLPLEGIRLNLRSHLAALRWCALTYNQPRKVIEAGKLLKPRTRSQIFLRVYLHTLPYQILVITVVGLSPASLVSLVGGLIAGLISSATLGFTYGLITGVGLGLGTSCLVSNSTIGPLLTASCAGLLLVTSMAASSLRDPLAPSHRRGSDLLTGHQRASAEQHNPSLNQAKIRDAELVRRNAMLLLLVVVLLFFVVPLAMVSAKNIDPRPRGSLPVAATFTYFVVALRLYYFPVHSFWLWPRMQPSLYRFHPVAWDHVCPIAFPRIHLLLVAAAELNPESGELEIQRLIDESLSHRSAALLARAILVIRRAGKVKDLATLDEVLGGLPEEAKGNLRQTLELRRRIHSITIQQAQLNILDRPFLREPFARIVAGEVETFEHHIADLKGPVSRELRKATAEWLKLAKSQLSNAQAAAARLPTRQVFRAGNSIDREQEAFVHRASILGEIEQQVTHVNGCPGLLVYGRRRMGKSTLLANLTGFLPPSIQIVTISMEDSRAFTSLSSFIGTVALRTGNILPDAPAPPEDLRGFRRLLEVIDKYLQAADQRLLLAIDEFELLDRKIGEGIFPQDLLVVVRDSIQEHKRITWAFVGSHHIDELSHAPWASNLVSARTIEVGPFKPRETHLLLTDPMRHSSLLLAEERPRFEPGFWGTRGIERIQLETGGWPSLVQLVAENLVDSVNDSASASVDAALFENALDRSAIRGGNFFVEILKNESRLEGEWGYLLSFREAEDRPPPSDDAVAQSLRRRLLVVEQGSRYRLRAPLMRRWLQQRA